MQLSFQSLCPASKMTLSRYRANDDRLATVRGVHEGLPKYGVYHGCPVAGKPGRGRRCVSRGVPEGLRTLRRTERQPNHRRLAEDGYPKPLLESPVALPGALAILFRNSRRSRRRGRGDAGMGRARHSRATGGDGRSPAIVGNGAAEAAARSARAPGALSLRRDELRGNRRPASGIPEQSENGHPSGPGIPATKTEVETRGRRGLGRPCRGRKSVSDVNVNFEAS